MLQQVLQLLFQYFSYTVLQTILQYFFHKSIGITIAILCS